MVILGCLESINRRLRVVVLVNLALNSAVYIAQAIHQQI